MLATTNLCPCCGKPRSIAHLLEMQERNFRLFEQLLPEMEAPFDRAVSRSQSDCPLHLDVVERDRYTLTVRLTYEFTDEAGVRRQPDLWVRLYRDACLAEALQCSQRPPWLAADERDPEAHLFLAAQWQRNSMLNKWLIYLLEHGHGFGMSARPRREPVAA